MGDRKDLAMRKQGSFSVEFKRQVVEELLSGESRPALILEAGIGEIAYVTPLCILGVFLISSALEGYLVGIERLEFGRVRGYLVRIGLIVSGVLLGLPGWQTDYSGLALALVILLPILLEKLRAKRLSSMSN